VDNNTELAVPIFPKRSTIPASSSILLPNVDTPEVTTRPPVVILTPLLAVMRPIASTLVTSSYVNVPAILTLPVTDIADAVNNVPSKVRLLEPAGLLEPSL
jgi:hypothetical protein